MDSPLTQSPPRLLFDAERLRIYPLILLALYAVFALTLIASAKGNADRWGAPLGGDFVTFYAAAKLTLAGNPAGAFDIHKIAAAEHAAVPGTAQVFQWAYPPTFQWLIAPLGLLPYKTALGVFIGFSFLLFALSLRFIPQTEHYRRALLFAPPVFLCLLDGQNSLYSAALFALGFALLRRRPFCAGLVLAGLAYKPQLGILLPVALVAAGQWRSILGAMTGTVTFVAVSTLVLGADLWTVFFAHLGDVQALVRDGGLPWPKMTSAFVFLRYLHAPETMANAVQFAVALLAAGTVALVWRKRGPDGLAFAVLSSATVLTLPYMFMYEFALLLVPMAFLAQDMSARGASLIEKVLLLLPYFIGLVLARFVEATHFQLGFPVVMLFFVMSARRALLGPNPALNPPALSPLVAS